MKYITQFKWTINHVKAVASPTSTRSSIFSENFLINGTSSKVCLLFVHTNLKDPDYCSLFISQEVSDTNAQGQAIYDFWIENIQGRRIGAKIERKIDPQRIGIVGVGHFVQKSLLYSPSSFIQDETFIIKCVVKYIVDSSKNGEDTKEISSENVISGCTLECNQLNLYVRRNLLIMKSGYFKRLLEGETEEAKTGIIHLGKIHENTMKKFVYFMNGRTFSAECDILGELYEVAYFYESNQLKLECESKFFSSIEMGHLLVSLKLGFLYNDSELKKHAIDKLELYHSPKMSLDYFKTKKWIQFAASDLKIALNIKAAAYKAVKILPEDYKL